MARVLPFPGHRRRGFQGVHGHISGTGDPRRAVPSPVPQLRAPSVTQCYQGGSDVTLTSVDYIIHTPSVTRCHKGESNATHAVTSGKRKLFAFRIFLNISFNGNFGLN